VTQGRHSTHRVLLTELKFSIRFWLVRAVFVFREAPVAIHLGSTYSASE